MRFDIGNITHKKEEKEKLVYPEGDGDNDLTK